MTPQKKKPAVVTTMRVSDTTTEKKCNTGGCKFQVSQSGTPKMSGPRHGV